MTRKEFTRDRPVLTVGVLGHQGHGKTTLVGALTRHLALRHRGGNRAFTTTELLALAGAPTQAPRAVLVPAETPGRRLGLLDCPGARGRYRSVLAALSQCDVAVLVVSAPAAVEPQTREWALAAAAAGVRHLAVFLTRCDEATDSGWLDEVEREVRAALLDCDLPGDDVPVLRGSGLRAYEGDLAWEPPISALAELLEAELPLPARDPDGPFRATLERQCLVSGVGVVGLGRVDRGRLSVGDRVQVLGRRDADAEGRVKSFELFRQSAAAVEAGDPIGVVLTRGSVVLPLARGDVLTAPGALQATTRALASVRFLTTQEGGRHRPVFTNHRAQCFASARDSTATLRLPEGTSMAMPGQVLTITLEFQRPMVLPAGTRFLLRDGCDGFRYLRARKGNPPGWHWGTKRDPLWGGTCAIGTVL
ncbi:MAG: 50S ribosome-binding GTPase [Deltaproteobacteria bacterium]|nr:50S ribosome-binding GTPase [Deltaproteobacteria bacterium]